MFRGHPCGGEARSAEDPAQLPGTPRGGDAGPPGGGDHRPGGQACQALRGQEASTGTHPHSGDMSPLKQTLASGILTQNYI